MYIQQKQAREPTVWMEKSQYNARKAFCLAWNVIIHKKCPNNELELWSELDGVSDRFGDSA